MKLYRIVFLIVLFLNGYCYADQYDNDDGDIEESAQEQKKEEKLDNKIQKEQMVTVKHHAFGVGGIYLTAQNPEAKIQSLMWIAQGAYYQFCFGLAPEKTIVNYVKDANNPLYNSVIDSIHIYKQVPVVVTRELPHTLFLIQQVQNIKEQYILSVECNDALGNQSSAIKAVTHGRMIPCMKENKYYDYIFAAVAPHNGIFGQSGSGLSIIKLNTQEYEDGEQKKEGTEEKKIRQVLTTVESTIGKGAGKAFSLDEHNEAININHGLESIGQNIILCWHPVTNRLYIGLHVKTTSHAGADQGASALLAGRLYNDLLSVDPIASFDNTVIPSLCAAMGPNKQLFIHHLKPYYTSTRIAYLLVVGGQGDETQTRKNLYAVPLVDVRMAIQEQSNTNIEAASRLYQDSHHGKLASMASTPCEYFNQFGNKKRLHSRCMQSMNYDENQDSYEHNKGVCVGAGVSLPGPIENIEVVADAIYVTIKDDAADQKAGVFHSQPIFDGSAKVVAWTPWRRVAGCFEGSVDFKTSQDQCDGTIVKATGSALLAGTQWYKRNKNIPEDQKRSLVDVLNVVFNCDNGGISYMEDISCYKDNALYWSWLLCAGDKKIVLAEQAKRESTGIMPAVNDYSVNRVTDMSNAKNDPAKPWLIEFSSEILNKLGVIESATVVSSDNQSWIVVASNTGIAVLADKEGHGITPDRDTFSDLSFQHIGNFKQVKKLIVDNNILYILTTTELLQVHITAESIKRNELAAKRIVGNKGMLFDGGICNGFALLASSKGLLINDIHTRIDNCAPQDIKWHSVSLPRMNGYPYKFFFVNSVTNENRLANEGQVYVLTGSLVENYSALYRLFFNEHALTNDSLLQWVPDIEYKDYPGATCVFNNFKNIFVTDGAHQFVAHPIVHTTGNYDTASLYILRRREINRTFVTDDKAVGIILGTKKATKITAIVQNSATGNWFVAGNFGLLANY